MSEYKMPKLGADMEDAILIEWKVKEGDRVQKGDIIAEIETVKGDIDVEVFEDGIMEKIIAQPGERLPVGTVLAYINSNGKTTPEEDPVEVPPIEEPAPTKIPEEVPPKKEPILPPKPTEIPPIEEPPTIIPSPGVPEEEIPDIPAIPEEVPFTEEPVEQPSPEEFPPMEEPEIPPLPKEMPPRIIPLPTEPYRPTFRHNASPLARKIAKDLGIDLAQVKGTGEGGIIHKIDVERFANSVDNKEDSRPTIKEKPKVAKDRKVKMRTAIAAAMSRSNQEIPHYYLETAIDMQKAMNWLQTENEQRPVQKRLLAAVLLLKASALALQKVPELNGYWEDNRLNIQEGIHIGFAISLRGGGLVIPAIHDVNKKSIDELMNNLTDVSERARMGKLRSSELTDGTITITNIGDRGVAKVFGVIYPPQVAIIGFGKIIEKPWAENGMLGIRPILTATLAADHRATDGRIGAKFLSTLNKLLQTPSEL